MECVGVKIYPGQEKNCFKAEKNLYRNRDMYIKKNKQYMPITFFDSMNWKDLYLKSEIKIKNFCFQSSSFSLYPPFCSSKKKSGTVKFLNPSLIPSVLHGVQIIEQISCFWRYISCLLLCCLQPGVSRFLKASGKVKIIRLAHSNGGESFFISLIIHQSLARLSEGSSKQREPMAKET